MFSPYWDAAPTSPSIPAIFDEMWADFSDFAEATWTDEADADEDEDELEGNEDAYLDEYYESRWEM